jgi:hypothetical protein
MKITHVNDGAVTTDQCVPHKVCAMKDPGTRELQKAFGCLSPAEHLKEAANALEDGYRVDSDPIKTVWGRLNDANRHLMAINSQASQYAAAQGLAAEVTLRKRQMKDACANAVNQHMVKQREILANWLEQYFVNKGIYAEVQLDGSGKTCLKVTSSVFQLASIKRIAHETVFFSHLKKVGFTSIVFENEDGEVRNYVFEPR